jgi:hypothetical protein
MNAKRFALAAAVTCLAIAQAGAQVLAPSDGLDVVLVVDVSGSMFSKDAGRVADPSQYNPNGSDPDRLRWDAVELVLNLLSAEDRVLILPFNTEAPAANFRDRLGRIWQVPSGLDAQLTNVGERRRALFTQVDRFIHSSVLQTASIDAGGTSILGALRVAAERARAMDPAPNRRLAVILLTDGSEDDTTKKRFPDFEKQDNLRRYLEPWSRREPGRSETSIYCIALGTEEAVKTGVIKLDYLRQIAGFTRGDFEWVQQSSQILPKFRDWIWQLKGCWTKPVEMSDRSFPTDTLLGIVDLGILGWVDRPGGLLANGRPDPRNTAPPSVLPEFTWEGTRGIPTPAPDRRSGKDGGGYHYWYFGRTSTSQPSPFAALAESAVKLTSTWPPGTGYLTYAKRTSQPLFVSGVLPKVQYQRHEELELQVAMTPHPDFAPEQFKLTMTLLRQSDQAAPAAAEYSEPMAVDPRARGFRGSISLGSLPRGPGATDYYSLRVQAEGRDQPLHALSQYRLVLPTHTIAVDNRLVLESVSRVELTNTVQDRRLSVPIRTRARIQEDVALAVRLAEPPRSPSGRPVPAQGLTVRSTDPNAAAGNLRLRNGQGTLEIALADGALDPPLERGTYKDGRIELTAEPTVGLEATSIPLGLRIDVAKLAAQPPAARLESRPEGDRTDPMQITIADHQVLVPANRPCKITLARAGGDAAPFDASELWIEPARGPGAARAPAQEIELPLDQAFRIGFRPRPDAKKEGRQHIYTWTASLPGAEPARGTLALDFKAPQLVGPEGGKKVIRLGRGAEKDVSLEVGIRGQVGDRRRVRFRPEGGPGRNGRFAFVPVGASREQGETTAIELTVDPDQEVEVVAAEPGKASPAEIHCHARVASAPVPDEPPLSDGRYQTRGILSGVKDDVAAVAVVLEVIVNSLQVLVEPPDTPGIWKASPRVYVRPFFDTELIKPIRLRTGLADPLNAGAIRITFSSFTSDYGDLITSPPPTPPPADVALVDEGRALELAFRFPPVANALERRYTLAATFDCPELELTCPVTFFVTFLNARPGQAPGKPAR